MFCSISCRNVSENNKRISTNLISCKSVLLSNFSTPLSIETKGYGVIFPSSPSLCSYSYLFRWSTEIMAFLSKEELFDL